jgi:hypothetical protein
MMRRAVIPAVLVGLALTALAGAQEGHPLTGTWVGDWGPSLTDREHLTVILAWDGERISGLINPGPGSVTLDEVVLDVADWTVRLRARETRETGPPIEISAEGQMENIESWHRTIRGRWRQGDREGDFLLTRD